MLNKDQFNTFCDIQNRIVDINDSIIDIMNQKDGYLIYMSLADLLDVYYNLGYTNYYEFGKFEYFDIRFFIDSRKSGDLYYYKDYKRSYRNTVWFDGAGNIMQHYNWIYQNFVCKQLFLYNLLVEKGLDDVADSYQNCMAGYAKLIYEDKRYLTGEGEHWCQRVLSNPSVVFVHRNVVRNSTSNSENIGKGEDGIQSINKNEQEQNTNEIQSSNEDKEEMLSTNMMDALNELESLVGLQSVKSEVNSLVNLIKMKQLRQKKGLKSTNISLHCVFTGNPGTGKTTVARIIANIYKELGVLQNGHLVETDRSGLVAEYIGQTSHKTNEIVDRALDGILFIDEAYTLAEGGNNDYGKEAIATLLKRMEDERERLIVILAGYTKEMERFFDLNPGLRSRFNKYIDFPDYTATELLQIFEMMAQKNDFVLSDEAVSYSTIVLEDVIEHTPKDFGNVRYIRNYFEKMIQKQANRLAGESQITEEKLREITKEDLII